MANDYSSLIEQQLALMEQMNRFYEPPSRLQLVDKLLHLIRFSDFLLVVTGLSGSGKSSLLKEVAPQSDNMLQVLSVRPAAQMDSHRLLSELVGQLPDILSDIQGEAARLESLKDQVIAADQLGQRQLILVDDAQWLTDGALAMLFDFMAMCQKVKVSPQIVLLGLPELAERIEQKKLPQQLDGRVHFLKLEPFTEQECREYLSIFHPKVLQSPERAIKKLILESEGSPGSIERLVRGQRIIQKKLSAGPVKGFPLPLPHLLGIGSILLAVTGLAAWQFMPVSSTPVVETEDRVSVPLSIRERSKESDSSARAELEARIEEQERLLASLKEKEAEKAALNPSDRVVAGANLPSPAAAPVEKAALTAVVLDSPVVSRAAEESVKELPLPQNGASSTSVVLLDTPVAAPDSLGLVQSSENLELVKLASKEPVVVKADLGNSNKADEKQIDIKPAKAEEKVVPAVVAVVEQRAKDAILSEAPTAVYNESEQKLLSWNSKGYTLQMLGAREIKSVRDFISDYSSYGEFLWFSTELKGSPWYVVVYKEFGTRNEASESLAKLPADLRKQQPWPRTISGIQQELRKRQP